MNKLEYYELKQKLYSLFSKRNDSLEDRIDFDNTLHKIIEFEVENGMVNENEFKGENNG